MPSWRAERLQEYNDTFTPSGPDSVEPILSLVELSVQNILELGSNFYDPRRRIRLLTENSLTKARFDGYFEQAVLSIEGLRFLGKSAPSWIANGAHIVAETAQFIPTVDAKQFEERLPVLAGKDLEASFTDAVAGERTLGKNSHYHFDWRY